MFGKDNNIVLADSWTNGSHHFAPYIDILISKGFNVFYLHINSINKVKEIENKREDVHYIDLFQNSGKEIRELYETKKVQMTFFLSTNSFFLELINSLAIENNTPTTHIYHGFNSLVNWDYLIKNNHEIGLKKLYLKAIKNIKILSIAILLKTKQQSDLSVCVNMFLSSYEKFIRYTPHGSKKRLHKTDFGIVFCKSDAAHMNLNYGVELDKIYINGFPDLNNLTIENSDLVKDKNVIYISTALTDENLIFESSEEYLDYLVGLRDELFQEGYSFSLKLKPHGDLYNNQSFTKKLVDSGITIYGKDFDINLFRKCAFVLTEPSTFSVIPIFIGVSVGLVSKEPLNEGVYGDFLTNYPKSFVYNGVVDAINAKSVKSGCHDEWRKDQFKDNGQPNFQEAISFLLDS